MIFVCTGTQVYQFNRLLKELDRLVEQKKITDEIFAQIGCSTYTPTQYKYKQFLSSNEFKDYEERANLIISHGGTGALISASKMGKNIIAVPRLAIFGEHVDDHQLQIVNVLEAEGYVRAVYDINELGETVLESLIRPINKRYTRESYIMSYIDEYISLNEKKKKLK